MITAPVIVKGIIPQGKGECKTAQTKPEIRQAWNRANMRQYSVTLHKEHEKDLIAYIESKRNQGTPASALLKAGIQKLIESDNGE